MGSSYQKVGCTIGVIRSRREKSKSRWITPDELEGCDSLPKGRLLAVLFGLSVQSLQTRSRRSCCWRLGASPTPRIILPCSKAKARVSPGRYDQYVNLDQFGLLQHPHNHSCRFRSCNIPFGVHMPVASDDDPQPDA